MSFGSPTLLAFLAVVPLAVVVLLVAERRRGRRARAWARPALLPNMAGNPDLRRAVAPAFFLAAVSLLLVGFARPEAWRSEVKPGATVVIAVDDSGSMAASDVAPTRLAAADRLVTQFVEHLPARYRAALVVFSSDEEVKVAPTYDRADIVAALPHTSQLEGTALGDALALAVRVATQAVGPATKGAARPPAAVLVVSDGGQNAGRLTPTQASTQARKAGVPVSTVVIGTAGGVVTQQLPVQGSSSTVTLRSEVPADPTALKQVASATGGAFYQAPSPSALDAVYQGLGKHLVHDRVLKEFTVVLIVAAVVLVALGAALSGYWFRRVV
jgi:Ca-activated chloride channel family protein